MHVWRQKIAKKLEEAHNPQHPRDKEHAIWKHARKIVDDDTGDATELEVILAKMLLAAYDLD